VVAVTAVGSVCHRGRRRIRTVANRGVANSSTIEVALMHENIAFVTVIAPQKAKGGSGGIGMRKHPGPKRNSRFNLRSRVAKCLRHMATYFMKSKVHVTRQQVTQPRFASLHPCVSPSWQSAIAT
jgi:hypothetical protein